MTRFRYVCAKSRTVDLCTDISHEHLAVSARWRAPRRTNDKAWKRIEQGEILWDRVAVMRAQEKPQEEIDPAERRARKHRAQVANVLRLRVERQMKAERRRQLEDRRAYKKTRIALKKFMRDNP